MTEEGVARLEARAAISELRARYAWHIARANHEAIAELFTPEGIYESLRDGRRQRCTGRSEILTMLREMLKPRILYPLIHNEITVVEGDQASGSCAMEARLAPELGRGFVGYYIEKVVRRDGAWLFSERLWYLYSPVFEESGYDEYGIAAPSSATGT